MPTPDPHPAPAEPAVFAEPWQAQAFALTVCLHDAGAFSWSDWAGALSGRIKAAEAAGQVVDGEAYHLCWLAALEDLVTGRDLAGAEALAERKAAWAQAFRDTPHGRPVVLAS